jgi:hypothetical protein
VVVRGREGKVGLEGTVNVGVGVEVCAGTAVRGVMSKTKSETL